MIKESVKLDEAIDLLNEMLKIDPKATIELIKTKVACNKDLADHPSIQVSSNTENDSDFKVGLLGFLNGLFGVRDDDSKGEICYVDLDGEVLRFMRTPK